MPNVFVVQEHLTLEKLADTLLRAKVTAKNRDAALIEIRRANPGLDFSAIVAGTVVVVPPVPGLKATATTDPAGRAVDDQTERLTEGLDALLGAAEAGEEQRKRDTEAGMAALDAILETGLAERQPQLAANAESARNTLKTDGRLGQQYLEVLRSAREGWLGGLTDLRALL